MYTTSYEATPLVAVPTASLVREVDDDSFTDHVFRLLGSPFQLVTVLLVPYHAFNLLFAVAAAVAVVAGTALGLGLLPLCCFGVLVLQGVLYLMLSLAKVDVSLYNCVAPRGDRILDTFHMPRQGPFRFAGQRLSPGLTQLFSQESFLGMFYFVLVKCPLTLLASVSSLGLLAVVSACFAFPFHYDFFVDHKDLLALRFKHGTLRTHGVIETFPLAESDWPQVAVFGVVLLYLTCVWMHVCAMALRATTKAFLCEYFTASGVVYCHGQGPSLPPPSAPPLYGSAQPAYAYEKQ
ncbi:hypothetical protein SPRG_20629 [Saprolegnia parasitica CBS 223.65]|uniref:Putative sensor domain-containing protein n=1 Tax=Saprolegnia parasitica (strain CBS 223.65) TaxID=695850 RepID=A0A067C4P7_SAPPC|nr:hypothetical protein SPRG_20629 [Saprolegnia parasitica CBS 223.65]KDO25503.1 hypothetical protein SPRG_20629 [Saprolegnia parasitica CBS 223.65]|eukprot:XP_012203739.1 hypothetical protein SPRG_20629 [Saprolegnia parasitica CBS 223.65]